jgi:hypothetical protein
MISEPALWNRKIASLTPVLVANSSRQRLCGFENLFGP